MDRNEFILAAFLLLFGAFLLGFLVSWAITRLSRVTRHELDEFDAMAGALHAAEEARSLAVADKAATEARLTARLAQSEAELDAAMDGLRRTRAEAEELHGAIAQLTADIRQPR